MFLDLGKPTPYRQGFVSLPPLGSRPADLQRVLTGVEFKFWEEWRDRILLDPRSASDSGGLSGASDERVYSDPALVNNPRQYGEFVRELLNCGVVSLKLPAAPTVALFLCRRRTIPSASSSIRELPTSASPALRKLCYLCKLLGAARGPVRGVTVCVAE